MFRPHRLCQGNPSTTPNSLGLKRFLLIVIPKSDSEGDRQRDLTMRLNHHGRKLGMTPCARTGAATLHRHDKPTLGPSLARFQRASSG
jgi:hypothetical protein